MVDIISKLEKSRAIEMILEEENNNNINFKLSIDCISLDYNDVEFAISEAKDKLDELFEEYKENQSSLQIQKKSLNKLMFHEILERGENLGLWLLDEKQKRLY